MIFLCLKNDFKYVIWMYVLIDIMTTEMTPNNVTLDLMSLFSALRISSLVMRLFISERSCSIMSATFWACSSTGLSDFLVTMLA